MKQIAIISYKGKVIFTEVVREVESIEYLTIKREAENNLKELEQDYENAQNEIKRLANEIEVLKNEIKVLKGED